MDSQGRASERFYPVNRPAEISRASCARASSKGLPDSAPSCTMQKKKNQDRARSAKLESLCAIRAEASAFLSMISFRNSNIDHANHLIIDRRRNCII